jgi:TonB family protein
VSLSYRHSGQLPWSTLDQDERRFYLITSTVLLIALLLGLIIPMIELPEKERFKKQSLPPRLARLVLEQKKAPPPKPKPLKKKIAEKKKPKPKKEKPKEAKKPEPVKKPAKQVAKKTPPPSSVERARKKAASSGLLAFADQLADLREEPAVPSKAGIQKRAVTGQRASGSVQRSLITSGAASGSGGINTAALSRDTGGRGLGGRTTTAVTSKAAEARKAQTVANSKVRGKNAKGNRTREEIQTVFDQNKGAVYALYNRALRKDPTLRGKVVLELTITPDGRVTKCRIVSSELNDKRLERKLISRIKLFKFLSKDVDTAVVSYPIDFLPS